VLLWAVLFAMLARAASPDLVVITVDTLRADHVGAWGRTPSPTPNIDALAERGVRFADASTPIPLTLPAHTTIFTGLLPSQHGIESNEDVVTDRVPLITDILEAHGYHTAAFVSGAPVGRGSGLEHRFQTFDGERPDRPDGNRFPPERSGAATVDAAIAWLAHAPEPFVLWVHLYDPHEPYTPPAAFASIGPYDGEVAAADAAIGHLLAALADHGLDDHTAVLLAGDHGESLGEHGELTHGVFLYQATLHVPLLLAAPGLAPSVVDAPVDLIDVAPTLLALAKIPAKLPGVDLREAGKHPDRVFVAASDFGARRYNWAPLTAVRQGQWKYIQAPHPELYDLSADPAEATNRIDDRPDVAARLARAAGGDHPDAARLAELRALGYVGADAGPPPPDPKDRVHLLAPMKQADDALYVSKFDDARKLLLPVVKEDPTNPVARNDLGMAWLGLKKPDKAVQAFRAAIHASPSDPRLWNNLGLASARSGDLDGAKKAYAEAARIEPTFAAPCVNLAVMYWRAGDATSARRWATEALARQPHMPEAEQVLSRLH